MPATPQTQKTIQQVLSNPDSFTTPLTTLLLDIFGTEFLTWEPTTLLLELQDDYSVVIPQLTFDRIQVGVQLLTSDGFYKSCPTFVTACNVMAGFPVGNGQMLADSLSCGWGIIEAMLLSPPDDDDDDEEPFTDEIRAYIGMALANDGIADPPDVLKIAIPPDQREETFDEDPDMYAAVKALDASKTAEVNALLKRSLKEMLRQLGQLPLNNGDSRGVINKLSKVF